MSPATAVVLAGTPIARGTAVRVEIPIARLPTGSEQGLPVTVVHGRKTGPSVWLSAAIHGDEFNGIEIVRRVLNEIDPERLRGTVIAVPVVNVFGMVSQSRYLPDRRDLNRSFPGSDHGSLAARLAHLFMTEIVSRCTHGIDFHTGSLHRTNLPQIRANMDDAETVRCAKAFGAPVILHGHAPAGSLRAAAVKSGVRCLVYEAGETHRFNRAEIEAGVTGTLRVLRALKMWRAAVAKSAPSLVVRKTHWIRARRSGILHVKTEPGATIRKGDVVAVVTDTFGGEWHELRARSEGRVLGTAQNPLVHQGDAVVHIGELSPG